VFASIAENGPLENLIKALAEEDKQERVKLFRDTDTALEW